MLRRLFTLLIAMLMTGVLSPASTPAVQASPAVPAPAEEEDTTHSAGVASAPERVRQIPTRRVRMLPPVQRDRRSGLPPRAGNSCAANAFRIATLTPLIC